ncbi:MAG: hypothetical protein GY913_03290 [Proteobacteria bacterium]|nr:hypothetical protein [Pseudomonadota bacterium]MCP4915925.1 hypothetical protein [Pseudomonadota bacterium]
MYNALDTDLYQTAQKNAVDLTNAMLDIQKKAVSAAIKQADVNLSTQQDLAKAWIAAFTVAAPKAD